MNPKREEEIYPDFNWVDDEIAEIKCPNCKASLTVTIYKEDLEKHKCSCGKKYLLHQINYVTEEPK